MNIFQGSTKMQLTGEEKKIGENEYAGTKDGRRYGVWREIQKFA